MKMEGVVLELAQALAAGVTVRNAVPLAAATLPVAPPNAGLTVPPKPLVVALLQALGVAATLVLGWSAEGLLLLLTQRLDPKEAVLVAVFAAALCVASSGGDSVPGRGVAVPPMAVLDTLPLAECEGLREAQGVGERV